MTNPNQAINDALISKLKDLVMSYILVQVPWLGSPIIKQIVSFFVNKVITILIEKTEFGIYIITTTIKTGEEKKAYDNAQIENQKAQASGSDEEKAKAQQKVIDAARSLISLGVQSSSSKP